MLDHTPISGLSYLLFGQRPEASLVVAQLHIHTVNCQLEGVVFVDQLLSMLPQILKLRLAACNQSMLGYRASFQTAARSIQTKSLKFDVL